MTELAVGHKGSTPARHDPVVVRGVARLLFHGGRLVRGTWTKKAVGDTVTLATKAGELTVPAGKTWIELVPVDAANGDVTIGK